jgi:hypothetical protein
MSNADELQSRALTLPERAREILIVDQQSFGVAVEIDSQALCCGNEDLAFVDFDDWDGELYRCLNCRAEFTGAEIGRRRAGIATQPGAPLCTPLEFIPLTDEEVPF